MLGLLSMMLLTGCSKNEHEASSHSLPNDTKNSRDIRLNEDSNLSNSTSSETSQKKENSTEVQISKEEISSTRSERESAQLTPSMMPYAVNLEDYNPLMSFQLSGVNVPKMITIDLGAKTVRVGSDVTYRVNITDIPTKTFKVFLMIKAGSEE